MLVPYDTLLTWGSYRRARSTFFLDGHRWAFVQVAPGGTGKAGLHRGHMAGASCGRLLYKLISGERRFWSIIRSTGRRNTHHIGKKNLFTTKGGRTFNTFCHCQFIRRRFAFAFDSIAIQPVSSTWIRKPEAKEKLPWVIWSNISRKKMANTRPFLAPFPLGHETDNKWWFFRSGNASKCLFVAHSSLGLIVKLNNQQLKQ